MKTAKTVLLIFFFTASSSGLLKGQEDSINKQDTVSAIIDSASILIQEKFNKKIEEIEQQRLEDSVKKAELELQINSLKTTDNLKKEELQKQLNDIKEAADKRHAQKKAQIDLIRNKAKAYPVTGFFNDTLFFVYAKLGSFSAKERAFSISEKIHTLGQNYDFIPDSLKIQEGDLLTDLVYGETIILSISEYDELWNNSTKKKLSEEYKHIITNAVLNYEDATSYIALAKQFGMVFLIILLIILAVRYILKFFKLLSGKIKNQDNKLSRGIIVNNYTLVDADRMTKIALSIAKAIKWFIILLIIYIALPILFGLFPWTKNFAETLIGYILNPIKKIAGNVWDYFPNLITIIVIIIVFRYFLKVVYFFKSEIENGNLKIPGFYPDWAVPTYQLVRVLIVAFMVVVIFPYLPGSDSPVFQGVTVFLGFLFTFGSAGSLSNIVSGLVLTYMRLFKIGDIVKIGDVSGLVIEKTLLVTRIKTIKNEIISIPNTNVMNSHSTNYSIEAEDKGLIIYTTVTIGYDVPWRNMHEALLDAASRTDLILKDPKPFVLQTSLDDFYVSYQINAYTRTADKQALIYSNLHQNIQDSCNEKGIEILSPHYRSARDGNMVTIPADYLPKDYKAPGFNVNISRDNDTE